MLLSNKDQSLRSQRATGYVVRTYAIDINLLITYRISQHVESLECRKITGEPHIQSPVDFEAIDLYSTIAFLLVFYHTDRGHGMQ